MSAIGAALCAILPDGRERTAMNVQSAHLAQLVMRLRALLLPLPLLLCLLAAPTGAQNAPERLQAEDLPSLSEDVQRVDGVFPGALFAPHRARTIIDDRYSRPYHATCYVYIGQTSSIGAPGTVTSYVRRFAVHAPDADMLPLARRVGRLLLLIYGEAHARLRFDHPSRQTVDVWLMSSSGPGQSPDVGGEQFRDQIYVYNIFADRRPIEWAREVAHEYGHYALPGIAGFTAPEEWANGYLGERLFWKWLRDDLHTGRLQPNEIPFVTLPEIDDYAARQIMPLIARFTQPPRIGPGQGFDPAALLARRDTTGMDNFIGLALTIDALYGSGALLSAFAYTEPKADSVLIEASDFLRGALTSLRTAEDLSLSPPIEAEGRSETSFLCYLPAGEWAVTKESGLRAWHLAGAATSGSAGRLIIRSPGWRQLTLTRIADAPGRLRLRKVR